MAWLIYLFGVISEIKEGITIQGEEELELDLDGVVIFPHYGTQVIRTHVDICDSNLIALSAIFNFDFRFQA